MSDKKKLERAILLQLVYTCIDDYITLPKTPPIIGTGKYHIPLIWGEVNIPAIFILHVGPVIDLNSDQKSNQEQKTVIMLNGDIFMVDICSHDD